MSFNVNRHPVMNAKRRSEVMMALLLVAALGLMAFAMGRKLQLEDDWRSQPAWQSNPSLLVTGSAVGWLVNPPQEESDQADAASRSPRPKKGISFLVLLTQGGWFMIPLVLLSVGVVTIAVERYLALRPLPKAGQGVS